MTQIQEYTVLDIANELNEEERTIRYWYKKFEVFFDVDREQRHKIFSEKDLNLMKYIQKLKKEQSKSIEQIEKYLKDYSEKIKNGTDLVYSEIKIPAINNSNIEMQDIMIQFANFISNKIEIESQNIIAQNQKMIREEIQKAVSNLTEINHKNIQEITETISNNLSTSQEALKRELNDITQQVRENEQKSMRRDIEMTNLLKENMALRKKEHQEQENRKKKKGFLSKIFG